MTMGTQTWRRWSAGILLLLVLFLPFAGHHRRRRVLVWIPVQRFNLPVSSAALLLEPLTAPQPWLHRPWLTPQRIRPPTC